LKSYKNQYRYISIIGFYLLTTYISKLVYNKSVSRLVNNPSFTKIQKMKTNRDEPPHALSSDVSTESSESIEKEDVDKNIAINKIHPSDLPGYEERRAFLKRKEENYGIDYFEEARAACRQQNINEVTSGRRRGISPVCYGAIFNYTWARFGSEWLMEKKEDAGERPKKCIKPSSPRFEDKRQKQPAELVRFEGDFRYH